MVPARLFAALKPKRDRRFLSLKETYGYRTARLLMKGVAPISY